jgi:hypothetical protein
MDVLFDSSPVKQLSLLTTTTTTITTSIPNKTSSKAKYCCIEKN